MNKKLKNIIIAFGIATLYALIVRLTFGVKAWGSLFSVMSITFLFLLPFIIGALTVYLSDLEKVKKTWKHSLI